VDAVRGAGFIPLPILNWPWSEGHQPDLGRYCTAAVGLVGRSALDEIEILNEPRIMGGLDGTRYGSLARAACTWVRSMRRAVRILLAGDYLQPDRAGPQIRRDWIDDVRAVVPDDLYDVVALHTYREPAPPETTRYESRQREWHAIVKPLPANVPTQVTEVGWNLHGVSLQEQGDYIGRELVINRDLGIGATYLFAPIPGNSESDFGLFEHDWTPRPSALAIRAFQLGAV